MKIAAAVFQQATRGPNEIWLQALKNAAGGVSPYQTLSQLRLKAKPNQNSFSETKEYFSAHEREMLEQSLIQASVS